MTAKEKAIDLVDMFWQFDMLDDEGNWYWIGKENAKQCALICVDEKIETYVKNYPYQEELALHTVEYYYLQAVKEEINKL